MSQEKNKSAEEVDLTRTVEGQALDYFEREKAEYEKRTGQKVDFVPPTPVTRTPIDPEIDEAKSLAEMNKAELLAEAERRSLATTASSTKAQIIAAIEEYDSNPDPSTSETENAVAGDELATEEN